MKNISGLTKCSISGCSHSRYRSQKFGYCRAHYYRYQRYGDPLFSPLGKGHVKGRHIKPDGYYVVRIDGKEVREHRYIMEKHLGRKLLPTEIVHHIDGNKLNNNIENLKVIKSVSKHLSKYKYGHVHCLFCRRNAISRQMCARHYQQWRNGKIKKSIPLIDHGIDF